MKIAELVTKLREICPDARFEIQDFQVIVHTRLRVLHDGEVVDYDNPEAIYAGPDEVVQDGPI